MTDADGKPLPEITNEQIRAALDSIISKHTISFKVSNHDKVFGSMKMTKITWHLRLLVLGLRALSPLTWSLGWYLTSTSFRLARNSSTPLELFKRRRMAA
jgi:hypothetical protein